MIGNARPIAERKGLHQRRGEISKIQKERGGEEREIKTRNHGSRAEYYQGEIEKGNSSRGREYTRENEHASKSEVITSSTDTRIRWTRAETPPGKYQSRRNEKD